MIPAQFALAKCALLSALLLICFVASLRFGAVAVGWDALPQIASENPGPDATVILTYRLPRVVAALVIGIYLGWSGLVFQAVLRNPLADPTLFGVSGGAALAVVGAMSSAAALQPATQLAQASASYLPMSVVPVIALVGGLVTTALVLGLAGRNRFSPVRMILIGVVVSAVLNAVVMALVLGLSESRTELAILWLAGSLYGRSFENILPTLPWGFAGILVIWAMRHHLSVLRFDANTASALGLNPSATSLLLLAVAAGLAANAVSIAGTVGFVGLIVPHIARRVVGPDISENLWACALIGALLVVSADTLGRTVAAPLEIPVGLMTSLIGAPVLAVLIRKNRSRTGHA